MICPDCGKLRHNGECDPINDENDELEMALAFNEMERDRLIAAQAARAKKEERHDKSV